MNKSTKLVLLFSALTALSEPALSLPAFPAAGGFGAAEGFGANTPGGRGGKIIEVTNLNDSGTGSLRAALTASGPRIVVFRVSGTILVKSKISVTQPFLTVAGQTAPGDGITLKNDPSNGKMALVINTHDVVLRFLRIRAGSSPNDDGNLDAANLGNAYNVVIDHCSFSWATDEVFTTGGARDFTLQWNAFNEGLNNASNPKGLHSKGLHLREAGTDHISVHHNLLAHNYDRNPNINTDGVVDLVNNVFYDAVRWTEVKDKFGEPRVNVVGNYYKWGPTSVANKSHSGEVFYYNSTGRHPQVFVKGNIGPHRPDDSQPEKNIVATSSQWMIVNSAFTAPAVTTYSALDAYNRVLNDKTGAGATLPIRDEYDARVVSDVQNGTGGLIDDPSDAGWHVLGQSGTAPADSDHDGMADAWEKTYFGSISGSSTQDSDKDGYTDVEEYLNGTDPLVAGGDTASSAPAPTPEPAPAPAPTQTTSATTLTFTPTADAMIKEAKPTKNYGTADNLWTDRSALIDFLMKFTVSGTSSRPILSAKLRLYNINASNKGGDFYKVADTAWSENSVNWNNAPAAYTSPFATLSNVSRGQWYEVDVTSLVSKDGTFSLRAKSTSSDGAGYGSKEMSGFAPQLVVTLGQ
ncbi:MAG: CBM96 family carbohydrate-binding protein [Gammaproteobacteria bacterium]